MTEKEHYYSFYSRSWEKEIYQKKTTSFHWKNERMTHQMAALNKKFMFKVKGKKSYPGLSVTQ